MTSVVLIHHDDYADWVFDSHRPAQGRRFTKARELPDGRSATYVQASHSAWSASCREMHGVNPSSDRFTQCRTSPSGQQA